MAQPRPFVGIRLLLAIFVLFGSYQLAYSQASCPVVLAGPDASATCTDPCVTIGASYTYSAETTSYVVFPVPYTPFAFNTGTQVIVNTDDIWSNTVNLPFNFCYFGVSYNRVVIGANGLISFNTTYAGNTCPWSLNFAPNSNPLPNPNLPLNSIMGVYQDIDPTNQGAVYFLVDGVAPCRKLSVSYYQVPYYGDPNSVSTGSCPSPLFATMQIVLYETTNVIDMFIQSKPNCTGWNGGRGVQGIQNATGTVAYSIPGRNNSVFTAFNDGVRFIPFGTSNVSFAWMQGATVIGTAATIQVCPAVPTTYTAQATYLKCDGTSVVITDDVTISPSTSLQSNIVVNTPLSCNGASNAVATASGTGGATPYTYLWSNGATTATATGLSAGTQTATITEAGGCVSQATVVLSSTANISVTPGVIQNVSCNGGTNGSITVSGANGTIPYQYLWSNGSNSATATTLIAGTYTVTVTDNAGCTASYSATITQPTAVTISTPVVDDVSCYGLSDGSLTIVAGGGTLPYSYAWSPSGGSSALAPNLSSGNYTVIVTDNKGCTATSTAFVDQPLQLNTALLTKTNVSCNGGADGTITVNTTGGVGPYQFTWTPNVSTATTASNLIAGGYSVLITDANGCNAALNNVPVLQPAPYNVVPLISNVSCAGGLNGSITLTVTGNTAPYQYLWNTGAVINSVSGPIGNYTATITDQRGCTTLYNGAIAQATALAVNSINITDVSCNGGSNGTVVITASGGALPYQYLWSNGNVTASPTSLIAGTYTVTVTDNAGCTANANAIVAQPTAIVIAPPVIVDAACFGSSTGSVSVAVNGGTSPYAYAWSPSGGIAAVASNLISGNYTVLVTDSKNCTSSATGFVNEPTQLTATIISQSDITCNGGNDGFITLGPTGGTAPYQYAWTPNVSTTNSAVSLNAGTYSIIVTDAKGCTNGINNFPLLQPAPFNVQNVVQNVLCNGGSTGTITLTVAGNTSPYQYLWSNGTTANSINVGAGNYTATITDFRGCTTSYTGTVIEPAALVITNVVISDITCNGLTNGSLSLTLAGGVGPYQYIWNPNVSSAATATNLPVGNYNYQIIDNNGCTTSGSSGIAQPPAIIATLAATQNVSCNAGANGSLTVNVSGGVAPYNYNWTPLGGTAAVAIGLIAGTYSVQVTDQSGCSVSLGNLNVTEPQPLSVQANGVNVTCPGGNDGAVTLIVQGGTLPYGYNWSTGATTPELQNITAGTYTVTVTDQQACTTRTAQTITDPDAIVISFTTIATSCNRANGTATTLVIGGTSPYQYLWSNSFSSSQLTNVFTGNYTVTVTDNLGCTEDASVFINALPLPVVTISGQDTICENTSATLTSSLLNAVAPVSYNWSPGSFATPGITVAPLQNQLYTIIITDGNNCTATASHLIAVTAAPTVKILDPDQASCLPFGFTFNAQVLPSNSTLLWNFGDLNTSSQFAPYHTYKYPGTYAVSLQATSAQGCVEVETRNAMITIHPNPDPDFVTRPDILYDYQPTAYFQNTTTDAISFWWNFGDGSPIETIFSPEHTYADTGIYYVTLVAENIFGCVDSVIGPVRYLLESNVFIPSAFTPNSDGKNDNFDISITALQSFNMQLFNRWGESIFKTSEVTDSWDGRINGKDCPEGVYVYQLWFKSVNGKEKSLSGRVTLYR